MSNYSVGELRRSATIMTSGPGSIVDMRAENSPVSGVHLGLEDWDRETPLRGVFENQKIYERRLCKKLGKKYFRLPPVIMNKQFTNRAKMQIKVWLFVDFLHGCSALPAQQLT